MRSAGKEPFPVMYVDGKEDGQVFAGNSGYVCDDHMIYIEMGRNITESVEKEQKSLGEGATCFKREGCQRGMHTYNT